MSARTILRTGALFSGVCLWISAAGAAVAPLFSFDRDTFAFANETVFEYHQGHASLRHENGAEKPKRFTSHCFVMSRGAAQFRKFARFDPTLSPLDDKQLAARIRKVTGRKPWAAPLAIQDRITIPGLGWPTYCRPGNGRIFLPHGSAQQARTQAELERVLARGEFFVAYLTTFPESLSINHGVLVYAKEKIFGGGKRAQKLRYRVYDPNHPDGPRTLEWSQRESRFLYQRDWDFVGGRVVVWQVYGRFLQ